MKYKHRLVTLCLSILSIILFSLSCSIPDIQASTGFNAGESNINSHNKHEDGKTTSDFEEKSNAHKEQAEKNKKEEGAVSPSEASSWLQSHNKWVQFASFMTWLGHQIGWFAIKGVYFFASYVEKALTAILGFISQLFGGGLVNSVLKGFPGGATALAWTILGTAIVFFGIRYMIKGEKLDLKSTLMNVLLIAVFLVSSSTIINQFVSAGLGTFNDAKVTSVGGKQGTFSLKIIQDNVVDLKKAVNDNNDKVLSNNSSKGFNNITDSFMKSADMAQIYKGDDKKKKINSYLEYEIDDVNDKGQVIASKIDNGWFSIFKSGYFRFGTRFFNILSELIIMAVAFALYGYLLLRNAIDLIFTKLVGGIASAMDIEKGTKLKTVVTEIGKSALGFAFTGISLCIFVRLFTLINNQNWNPVAQIIALVATTIACLDGAKIFDRLFGVDVGIRSGWEATVGAFSGARMATSTAGTVAKAGAGVASGAFNSVRNVSNGVMSKVDKMMEDSGNKGSNATPHSDSTIGSALDSQKSTTNSTTQTNSSNQESMNQRNSQNDSMNQETDNMMNQGQSSLDEDKTQHVDTDGSISAYNDEASNVDIDNVSGNNEINSDEDSNAILSDEASAVDTDGAIVSAEDNDMNTLNEDATQAINNTNNVDDNMNLNQDESVYSNGVVGEDSSSDAISTDIEGLEAKVSDNNTIASENNVQNGVDMGLQENATDYDNNQFDGANGLNTSSYEMNGVTENMTGHEWEGNHNVSYPSSNDTNVYSDSVSSINSSVQKEHTQSTNIMNDNSQSNMNTLSQQAHTHQSTHLGVNTSQSSTLNPMKRSSGDNHQIQMPSINDGGTKEAFDHTRDDS